MKPYAIRRKIDKFHVVRVGPRGGETMLVAYGDETSAVKLCDLLISQHRYERKVS